MATSELPHRSARPVDSVLGELPLMALLSEESRSLVAESFVSRSYVFGETIVREDDPSDGFYVLRAGVARVLKAGLDGNEVSLQVLSPGDCFGEGDLGTGGSRSATVRAASEVECLQLDLTVFRALVRLHPRIANAFALQARARRLSNFLRTHSTFSRLPVAALTEMLEAVEAVELSAGDLAVCEGDPGGPLFIVEEGRLRVYQGTGPDECSVEFLRPGDVFGERSLYLGEPRAASVQALSPSRLLRLSADALRSLLDEHPQFRARVEERIAAYRRSAPPAVPLDFAELLPADASEAAQVAPEPARDAAIHAGAELGELDALRRPPPASASRRARFPIVRQLDESDCGAACVSMICRHFGREVAVSHIRMAVGTGVDGTSLRGIQRGGEHVGLGVQLVKASTDRVQDLALPAVIHWGGNHWVVLHALDGDRAHIADPARGRRRVGREDLIRQWSGYAALFTPTDRLADAPLGRASARWLADFVRPYRRRLLAGLGLALVTAGLEMLFPVLSQQVIDRVLVHRNRPLLNGLTAAMIGVLAVSLAVSMVQRRLFARVAVGIDVSTLDYLTGRLLRLPLSYFETRRTGDIERRLDGMRQIRELLVQGGVTALTATTQLLVALVLMFVYSPLMASFFVATTPLYLLLMRFSARRLAPTFEGLEEEYGRFRSRQIDGIKGIATVKAMGAEEGLRRMLVGSLAQLARRMFRADFTVMAYEGVVSMVTFLTVVVFLYIGALEVLAHHLTVGGLVAFNALILLANSPLATLLAMWDRWQMSRVLLGRVQDIFDYGEEQPEEAAAYRAVPTLGGRIGIRNASFSFPHAPSAKILSDISIEIAPGATVAVVGRSGSGKSTLAKCLAGLLPLTGGSITYDGVALSELRFTELRRRIGYVLQEPYLFDDTIAANIAFGEDGPDPTRLRWAAEAADALDFIERLPLGFKTRIGESGIRLSGGQAQRVSIARALYHRPPVLILDEATSALDAESERAVKHNLDAMFEARTAIVIAHRLSTIREADVILVLEQGRLVEHGTHEQLMARQGLYQHLTAQQLV